MTNGWCIPCVHHHLDPSVIVRSISEGTAPPQDIGGVGNTMTRMCAVGETVGRRMFRGEVVPRPIHTMFGCMIGESGVTTPCRSLRFLEQTNRWCSLVSWVLAVHHDTFRFFTRLRPLHDDMQSNPQRRHQQIGTRWRHHAPG